MLFNAKFSFCRPTIVANQYWWRDFDSETIQKKTMSIYYDLKKNYPKTHRTLPFISRIGPDTSNFFLAYLIFPRGNQEHQSRHDNSILYSLTWSFYKDTEQPQEKETSKRQTRPISSQTQEQTHPSSHQQHQCHQTRQTKSVELFQH